MVSQIAKEKASKIGYFPKNEKMKLVNSRPCCAGVRQRCQIWVAPTFPTWRNVFQELQRQRQTQTGDGRGYTRPGGDQINCSDQRGDKVTLSFGGCDSLWSFSKNCKDKDKRKLGNKRFHTQRKLGTGGVVLHTGPGGHQINCTRQKNQLQPPNEEIKSL